MIAALAFLFSYVRYRFLPIVVIAFGVVVTFGIMVMADLPVSTPVIGSFPVIIGLGIDYAVQFHSRFNEEVTDKSVPDAVYAMLTKSGPVHLVAMCTTMIGFLALLFTPIPMIAHFGSACIIGVVSSFAIALILLPVFFLIKGYNSKDSCRRFENKASKKSQGASLMGKYDRFLGNFAEKMARHAVIVILIFGFIAVVGINFNNDVGINVDRNTFVPSDMPAKIYNDKVKNLIGSPTTFPVLISGDYITSPDVLEWSESFSEYTMQKHPEITGYKSIATLIKQYDGGVLPKTAYETKEILEGIPDENKNRYLDGNIRSVIEFETTNIDMKGYSSLLTGISDDIEWYAPPPGITAVPTGSGQLNGYFYENILSSQSLMTIAALLMIFIFMLLVYRRFLSLAPMIPVIMIVGWNALIMYILGIEYTPLTACLGSMTIGLAMDYTILIMERCEEEMDKGEDLYFAIRTGVQKIGSAITISGVTTLLGFSAMITSDFSLVSMFGQTTVITILFSLIGGIAVMPAVVAIVYRNRIKNYGNKSKMIPEKEKNSDLPCLG
ncbi:MAG: MMPL family transporter, partial [Methanomicrobium sp.]|nr:MMPL family transporter [Methanomicrobium sp.]